MRSAIVAVVLCSLLPASARAQETTGEVAARALFERARAAYAREVYTEAEDLFLAAYEAMDPSDERRVLILLNVAQSIERQGGRDEDALNAWQRFRDEASEVAEPEHLARAEERIRELTTRVERRRDEPPERDQPAEPSGGFNPHWSGIVVTAVGGAALLAGVIVGSYGLAERGDVLSMCSGTACPEEVRDRAAELDTLGIVADSLLWPGVGIAAAGVLLMLLVSEPDDEAPVAASCGPGGCNLVGRW